MDDLSKTPGPEPADQNAPYDGVDRLLICCRPDHKQGEQGGRGDLYRSLVVALRGDAVAEAWEGCDCEEELLSYLISAGPRPAGPGLWVWEGTPEWVDEHDADDSHWAIRGGEWLRPSTFLVRALTSLATSLPDGWRWA